MRAARVRLCCAKQSINWLQFVKMMFSEVDVDITDTEEIIVRCPDYVSELGRLLKKTSPRSVIVGAGSSLSAA